MLNLQECLRVVINNASSDVRYSIANIGMQVTASYFQLISSPLNEQDLLQQMNMMDINAQFLHILIHRMLFSEAISISDKKTINLLQ